MNYLSVGSTHGPQSVTFDRGFGDFRHSMKSHGHFSKRSNRLAAQIDARRNQLVPAVHYQPMHKRAMCQDERFMDAFKSKANACELPD